jgi:hypothetical protein
MNTAKTIDEVCDRHGLDKAAWTVDSNGRKLVLRAAGFNIDDSEDVVKAKFGPPKGSARALVKLQEAKKEEEKGGKKGTGLKDLNRISLEFHDPLVMALMFECLKNHKTVKIVTVKNKFKLKAGKAKFEQPPDLHVNVDIGDGWLCEVQVRRMCERAACANEPRVRPLRPQGWFGGFPPTTTSRDPLPPPTPPSNTPPLPQFLFRDILLIKKELHKFYDVNRATSEMDVAGPLFSQLPEDKPEADDLATGAVAAQEGELDAALAQKVGEFEAFKKASAAALAEKDAALAEKDAALAEKDSALAVKDAALAEKDAALSEKDAALAAALSEKDTV